MSSVDERIVEMRFDNQQFESGVKTSLNTLDKLQDGLDSLGDSAGSLTNLQTVANDFDISSISNGVDAITNRFSMLGIVADQAIRTATNGLINLGVSAANAVKNLTLSPISQGFSQYEQETKSVQTLMNATGLGMEQIEQYTQKLGFYVDETSYSYESMFSTLASMMSSGVEDVDQGVAALIGLGNAAGLAGVDAGQATHAFEGFGKAIGQGYMDSRTWSWIKTSRMDTIALKQAFIDAGVGAGKLVQETDKAGNTLTYVADSAGKAKKSLGEINAANMENFFGEKWLNRDVMLEGVGKYSVAFEQIYADYLETGEYAEDIIDRLGDDLDEYSLKAFKAANQTRTFSDVVEYIAGAASRRWSTAFKKIFGNFEESSALWASLIDPMYDLFITPLDNMNDLLDNWRDLGGYEHVVNGIGAAFEGLVNVVTSVRSAFSDIFPKVTSERLFNITEGISAFNEKFRDFTALTEDEDGNLYAVNGAFANLIRGFKGGLSVVSLIGKGFKTFFTSLSPTTNLLKKFGDQAITAFGKLGQVLIDFNNSKKVFDFLNRMSENLVNIQTKFANAMEKVNSRLSTFISSIKDDVIDGIKGIGSGFSLAWKGLKAFAVALSPIGELLKNIGSSFGDFLLSIGVDFASIFGGLGRFLTKLNECNDASEIFASTQEAVSKVVSKITEKFGLFSEAIRNVYSGIKQFVKGNIKDAFKNIFKNFDINTVTKALTGLGASLAGVNLYRLIDAMDWQIREGLGNLKYNISDTLGTISDAFYGFGKSISASVITKIAIAIGLLAGSLLLLGSVKPETLAQGLLAITILLAELYGIMALFKKNDIFSAFSGKGAGSSTQVAFSMLAMAGSILLLASAVKKLSNLDPSSMMNGLVAIISLMAVMTQMSIILSKKSGDMAVGAAGMIGMAAAVLILSAAVKSLASIDSGFGKGLLGTIALMAAMTVAGIAMSKWGGKLTGTAIGMIGMAAAMVIMASAAKQFASIDANGLGNAIFGIGALLAIIAAFNAISGSAGKMLAAGASLLAISAAFVIMGSALQSISSIDASSLGNSIFGITALLAVIAAFNQLGGSAGKMIAASASLLIVSAALVVMSGALSAISAIDANSLGNSIFGIMGLLTVIAAFNQLGGSALNMIGMAAGLLIMSVALTALVPALLAMGAASGTAADGILILAGIFIVLGAAGALLAPVIVPILALSAALLVISAAIAVAGAGLLLLSAGMTAFAGALTASVAEILAGVSALILGLAAIATSLVAAVASIISAIALGLATAVPTVVAAVLMLILGIMNALVQNIPAIAAAAIQLVTGLINAIASQIGPLVEAGINLIVSFIQGMADAIDEHGDDILNAVGSLIGAIIGFIGEALARLVSLIPGVGPKMGDAIRGLTDTIKAELSGSDLDAAGEQAVSSIAEGAESASGDMTATGENLGESLVEGVESTSEDAETAGEDESLAAINGLLSNLSDSNSAGESLGNEAIAGFGSVDFTSIGSNGADGLINGLISRLSDARSAGSSLGNAAAEGARAALDEHSPSKVFEKIGQYSGEGYCIGVNKMLGEVSDSTEYLGDVAANSLRDSMKTISDLIDSDIDSHPVITPVLDLSAIQEGKNSINSILNGSIPIGINESLSSKSNDSSDLAELISIGYAIISEIQNGSDLYFDDGALAGRINRRLGLKV